MHEAVLAGPKTHAALHSIYPPLEKSAAALQYLSHFSESKGLSAKTRQSSNARLFAGGPRAEVDTYDQCRTTKRRSERDETPIQSC
jgi:hypothetical protein